MVSPGRVYLLPIIGVFATLLPPESVSVGTESSGVFTVTPPQPTVYTGVTAGLASDVTVKSGPIIVTTGRTLSGYSGLEVNFGPWLYRALLLTGRVLGGYSGLEVNFGSRLYTTLLPGRKVDSINVEYVIPSGLCTSPATAYILYVQYEDGTPVMGGKLYMFSANPKYYTSADIYNGIAMMCTTLSPYSVGSASYIVVDYEQKTYIAAISNLTKQPSISSDVYTATVTATARLTKPYKFQIDLQTL
jgi:hypothetical protein